MSALKGTHSPVDPLRQFAGEDERSAVNVKLLRDVVLTPGSGVVEVPHGLGRPYIGAAVLGLSEAILVVVLAPSASSDATRRLALVRTSDRATTATLVVYY